MSDDKQDNDYYRPYVAVASYEGVLVNRHLGEADYLMIFQTDEDGCHQIGRRSTPPRGGGSQRWQVLADLLGDCHALLTNGVGEAPLAALADSGISVYEVEGIIVDALLKLQRGEKLRMPHRQRSCRHAESGGQPCA